MVEGVPAQGAFRQRGFLQGQGGQALLHHRAAGQQAQQLGGLAGSIGERLQQVEHAAALGEDRLAGLVVGADGGGHGRVAGQLRQVQLRVATGQVEAVHRRQLGVHQGREEHQLGTQALQQVEVARVEEGEGGVTGDADAHALEPGLQGFGCRRGEGHGGRQRHFGAGGQGVGGGVQAGVQVGQLLGLHQPQVAAGQLHLGAARQGAVPADPVRQAVADQVAVALAADAVAEDAGERQVRLVGGQAHGQGAEGLGHGGAVDHPQHRHAEVPRQVGGGRRAVEQPHDALDEDQVRLPRRFPQQAPALGLADHPQVQLVDRVAGGAGEDHRVEEVRPALEHPHAPALAGVQARQGGGDGGLALAGSGCGDEQCGAGAGHQNSTPFWAFTPALKACLTRLISVTVSAASISASGAPRPVATTCWCSGRDSMSRSTVSRSR